MSSRFFLRAALNVHTFKQMLLMQPDAAQHVRLLAAKSRKFHVRTRSARVAFFCKHVLPFTQVFAGLKKPQDRADLIAHLKEATA